MSESEPFVFLTHGLEHRFKCFLALFTVEKMKSIDKEYEGFSYNKDKWFPFQSKMAEYRKEIEAQMQAEMNTKVLMKHSRILIPAINHIHMIMWTSCFIFYFLRCSILRMLKLPR